MNPGFLELLGILPQIYAAQLRPQLWIWVEEVNARTTLQDYVFFAGSEEYVRIQEALKTTTRMELHFYPSSVTDEVYGDISLHNERSELCVIGFTYSFSTEEARIRKSHAYDVSEPMLSGSRGT
jgi:hypothetical protein